MKLRAAMTRVTARYGVGGRLKTQLPRPITLAGGISPGRDHEEIVERLDRIEEKLDRITGGKP